MASVISKTYLFGGDDWSAVTASAADALPQTSSRLALLSVEAREQPDGPFLKSLLAALRARSGNFETLTASTAISGWLAARSRQWTEVDLSGRGDRLARATLPAALFEAEAVAAIVDLTSFNPKRPAIAIGLWAQFAHPRQRFGAVLGDQATGLVAEIALAAPAAIYFIAASWRGKPMLAVADDMIAAELIGLAIGQAQADPDLEPVGPWEQPLVQRAGDLGLGVRLPAQIEFAVEWLGSDGLSDDFAQFGRTVAARIGVAPVN